MTTADLLGLLLLEKNETDDVDDITTVCSNFSIDNKDVTYQYIIILSFGIICDRANGIDTTEQDLCIDHL